MAKFTAIHLDDVEALAGYPGGRDVTGARWSKQLSPEGYSLWLVVSNLAAGAVLRWPAEHGDEAVCVLSGELEINGRRCPTGGAVVVESGVACEATAVTDAVIAHYGPSESEPPSHGEYGPPKASEHCVHVVGDNGWYRSGGGEHNQQIWWADSRCPTCRISVFKVLSPGLDLRGTPHEHTEDEIVFMLDGQIRMGALAYGAGTALSIPKGVRYALGGDGRPRTFLNYRRDASYVALTDGSAPRLECGETFGGGVATNDFR